MLDKTQTLELNKKAKDLFQRVKYHSDDVDLAKQAQILEAQCCLLLNDPKEALILLEGSEKPQLSGELLQVNAHLMLGETENAKSDYEREEFEKRAAALSGKVAVIKVGGASETEIDEKKHFFDEAEKAHGSDVEVEEKKEEENA